MGMGGAGPMTEHPTVAYTRVAPKAEIVVPIGNGELVACLFTTNVTTPRLWRLGQRICAMAEGFDDARRATRLAKRPREE